MASLADMIVSKGYESAQTGIGDVAGSLSRGIASGAQLAAQAETIQQNREKIEMMKQDQELNKIGTLVNVLSHVDKVPKNARMDYLKGIQQNYAGKLKLPMTDEFIKAYTSPDVNQGAVGQTFSKYRQTLSEYRLSENPKDKLALKAELDEMSAGLLSAFGGDVSKFAEYTNSAWGQEASAVAQERSLKFKAQKEAFDQGQTAPTVIAQKKAAEKAGQEYEEHFLPVKASAEAGMMALNNILDGIEKGDVKTRNLSNFIPFLKNKDFQTLVNPTKEALKNDAENLLEETFKATLGAQFTEGEGKRRLARIWDDQQGIKENVRRVRALLRKEEATYENKVKNYKKYKLISSDDKVYTPPKKFKDFNKSQQDQIIQKLATPGESPEATRARLEAE